MTASYQNLLKLIGMYYAQSVSQSNPITDAQLFDIKVTSDFINSKLKKMFKLVQRKITIFTRYEVIDWIASFDYAGWSRVPDNMAIIGFWRAKNTQILNLDHVLAGQGFWTTLDGVNVADWERALDNNWSWARCDNANGGG